MDLPSLFVFTLALIVRSDGHPRLLFANRYNICAIDVTPGGGYSTSTLVLSGLKDAAALDFLFEDQVIYWTDVSGERVKSARLVGAISATDVVSTGLVSPDGLACDWITRKLYWVDSETNRIEACNLDGSMRKVLFWKDLDQPRAIVLDPIRGYFYWTDWGETAKIERASMDGLPSSRQVLISSDIFWPNGLAIDHADARMYWTDARLHYIHSANLDGSDRRPVVSNALPHPFAITVFEGALYWTDWQTKSVYTSPTWGTRSVRVVVDKLYSPMGIHVFNAQRQPLRRDNPCASAAGDGGGGEGEGGGDNGGCSHLCFLSPWSPFYSCQCPTGIRLLEDNRTCDSGPSEMLLLARRTDIRLISLDTLDFLDVVLDIGDIRHAIALDYDPIEKMIYWTDDDLHIIRRSHLNGSGIETVLDVEVYSPDGIAVDWFSRNLYWTDTGSDLIQVARLNGTSRKVIISDGLDEPRAIVLDPLKGQMYWTDWGRDSKIEKASLDGTDRLALVNVSLGWPNGLTIDRSEGKLYWADAKLDRIEYVNLDGSGRRILVAEHIPHIFGFALLGDYVYWTDWQRRSIERVNKSSGKQRMIIVDQLPDIMGLTAVAMPFSTGKGGGCSEDNGGCSHLCLTTPQGPVCACPFGMELLGSTRKICVQPEALVLYTKQSEIHVASLENVDNDIIIPLHDLKSVSDIDFDFASGQIYWADTGNKMICRAYLNGSLIQPVIRYGLESPDHLAVDWLARNLYWTDSGSGRIEMSRLDGKSRRVVLWKDMKPRALLLDPNNGFMYWINALDTSRIERAALDGTQRRIILTNVDHVNSLAMDYADQRLYWTNLDPGRIESSTVDGRSRHDVVTGLRQPYSLTVYGNFVYWTDWQTGSIHRANKVDGLEWRLVVGEILFPMNVAIFHSSRQLGWSPCGLTNGGCLDLCITYARWTETSHYMHHCLCGTHRILSANNHSCMAPDLLILVSQKNSIVQLSVDAEPDSSPDIPLALPPHLLRGIRAFDFNPFDENIYWVDGKAKMIRKMKSDGTNMVVLVQNTGSVFPFDIIIDSVDGLIYWSDSARNVISVLRIEGSDVGVIVNSTEQRPRALALASESSLIFWTNLGISSQSIACSEVDGSDIRILFGGDFGFLGPIAADAETKTIFWSDIGVGQIESGSFDGTNRQVLVRSVSQPVGLAVYDHLLFWADKESKLLEQADKKSGRDRQTLKSRLPLLSDLVLVRKPEEKKPARSVCAKRNLQCSHLCVRYEDGTARCSCPLGLILDVDGQACVLSLPCATNQFACLSGANLCIPLAWKCDGEVDCKDGSDEASCLSCPSGFSCLNGECISLEQHCNGHKDCRDGSDEKGCVACRESTTECRGDRTCYTKSQLCDGVVTCWDGFDEMNCAQIAKHGASIQYTVVVIGAICGILLIIFVIAVAFLCRQRSRYCVKAYGKSGAQNLGSLPTDLKCAQVCSVASIRCNQTHNSAQQDASSEAPPNLCRSLAMDTSTLTSFVSHYPRETLNPPPTPITSDTSTFNVHSSDSTSMRWTKRARKLRQFAPPPPTTPCSTDVCEDSELYSVDEQHRFLYTTDGGFETDLLFPPPPTPCSQFFSDGYSGPPSPRPFNFRSRSSESSLNIS